MKPLSHRTDTFTDSVIRRMTRISLKYDAVNLSQGFPDFEPPREILDRLAQVSKEDFLNDKTITVTGFQFQKSPFKFGDEVWKQLEKRGWTITDFDPQWNLYYSDYDGYT